MIERVLKRFVSLLLATVMVISLMPAMSLPVHAATVNTGVTGLNAESSGSAIWTYSNGTITGSATASSSSVCGGRTTYTAQTGTLTFTNSLGVDAVLSFDYIITLSGGSATVDGGAVTAGDSMSKKLQAGETLAVSITSNAKDETATSITISNLSLKEPQDVTTTFVPAENGSYTVDGTAITAETEITKNSAEEYSLVATAASGYKFVGWYSLTNDEYLSFSASAGIMIDEAQSITAKFVSNDTATFGVSGAVFTDLHDAVEYADANGKPIIVLLSNGNLPAGDYTIPAGKTLLIPFDDANTVYTTAPEVVYGSHANPSAFRTLTMESGASITVENGGSISVPSKLSASGQHDKSWNGTPTGKHGRIDMQGGSSIIVNGGGNLYVYGYISGDGSVTAESGSTVYECFQIRCWRGGTATSGMADNSQKVFPLNQYYVQNIEAPLTLESGATEKVYTAVNMSSQAFAASATFIGDGGMFEPGGSLTKSYDGSTDRLILDVDGDFTLSPMSLRITGLPFIGTLNLNTSDYVLPINSNISIYVNSGKTTVSQDVAFLPGSELTISQGASVELANGKKVYVYDKDQWGAYAASGLQLVPVGYSTVNGTTAKRTAGSLTDAKLDINGEFNLNGELYTTESGAAIVSSGGTGEIRFNKNAGTEENTYQATQSGSDMTYVSIPITSAKLLNGDGTYTETTDATAGLTYYFCKTCKPAGIWETKHTTEAYKLTLLANIPEDSTTELTEEQSKIEQEIAKSALDSFVFPTDTFNCIGYDLTGWIKVDETQLSTNKLTKSADAAKETAEEVAAEEKEAEGAAVDETVTDETVSNGNEAEDLIPEENKAEESASPDDAAAETAVDDNDAGQAVPEENASEETDTDDNKSEEAIVEEDSAAADNDTAEETASEDDRIAETKAEKNAAAKGGNDEDVIPADQITDYVKDFFATEGNVALTLKASWTPKEITIAYAGLEDAQLDNITCEYGSTITLPTAENVVREQYVLAGWTLGETEFAPGAEYTVVGDIENDTVTFTAKWEPKKFTITWMNGEEEITTTQAALGEKPVYVGDTPVKADDEQYTYTFTGWEDENGEALTEDTVVSGDATYYAVFEKTAKKYTITFINENGDVLQSGEVEYGALPVYDGETPVKASTDEHDYTFAGWTPELTEVTEEETYTATFTESTRVYTVTWKNDDGAELKTDQVEYGQIPEYSGAEPQKADDAGYSYTFSGWSPEIAAITEDTEYTAQYTRVPKKYTVTWKNSNGEELETDTDVEYGATPSYDGATPTKESTPQYDYTFEKWTPEITAVSRDITYTAVYKETTRSYTVIWMSEDGKTELDRKTVEYGTTPVFEGEAPQKESTAQYTYTFAGWFMNDSEEPVTVFGPVEGEVTYTAAFTETVNKYTVTFKNDDGTTLASQLWEYGELPSYDTDTLVKESTAEYSYTFAGWTPEVTEVTGDAEYMATYEATKNTYTVTWVIDGEKTEETYEYGELPTHDNPYKDSTAEFDYSFERWQPELSTVTGNAEYVAVFTASRRSYTVTWQNEDGTELYSDEVEYGTVPVYNGETPTKEADDQFTYTFAGWTPNVAAVTGEATYKAAYTTKTNSYEIKFVDYDGTELQSETLEYGAMPSVPEDPSREDSAQYSYTFNGWTPEVTTVTGAATYTATYAEEVRSYTIIFENWDGEELDKKVLEFGVTPEYSGDEPVREGDAQYTYAFKGWDPAIESVTGDKTYTAQYDQRTNTYVVTWKDENGDILETDPSVEYGTMPSFDGEEPVKDSTGQYDYSFDGWSPEIAEVTGDAEYTAVYKETLREYTVTWVNEELDDEGNHVVLEIDEKVEYGEKPAYDGETPAKEPTDQYTYVFDKWVLLEDQSVELKEDTTVTGDVTYLATYTAVLRKYTVTWTNDDGTVLETDTEVPYGSTPSYDGATPVKTSTEAVVFSFAGWEPEIDTVTGDITYAAKFEPAGRQYAVTWKNGDTVLATTYVSYGENPAVPEDIEEPEKDETVTHTYRFTGWADENGNALNEDTVVKGDVTFNAVFEEEAKNGWVRWTDNNIYYVEEGKLATGICRLTYPEDSEFGYAEPDWNENVDSGHPEDGKGTFIFDADGKLQTGENGFYSFSTANENAQYDTEWLDGNCTVWAVRGEILWHPGLVNVDGEFYYFKTDNTMVKARDYNITKTNGLSYTDDGRTVSFVKGAKYTFDADGVLLILNGFVDTGDVTYYYEDSVKTYAGLIKVGDDYYYVKSDCTVVKGRNYYVGKTNGLMDPGTYTFDEEGKMVIEAQSGIHRGEDGLLHYYKDGVIQKNLGLIELDGKFYYVNGSGEVISGKDYAITRTNGLSYTKENGETAEFKTQAKYTFDQDGVLKLYDGLVKINGKTYYYEDAVKTYAGLIEIEGDYYYIKSDCSAVCDGSYYVSKTNGLLDAGKYEFDENCKMIIETENPDMKEGILRDEEGVLRYYVEDEMQKNNGLIEIDGKFYYVNGYGEVVNGKDYYITRTNGLAHQNDDGTETAFVSGGQYTFDENGVLGWHNGITDINGVKYYYVDGVKTYAGLVEIDGALYYVNSSCKLVVNSSYYVSKTNGLKQAGTYSFDAEGKLID